jgi:hypothetical protein
MGQFVLGLYFLCHLVARLILTIAIYATAEATPGAINSPTISKLPASILITILCGLHFGIIYSYKYYFIREFRENNNDIIERIIHVLANTLVVIPFMTWDVEGPSRIEYPSKCEFQAFIKKSRTGSLDDIEKALSAVKISNKWANRTLKRTRRPGHRKNLSAGNIVLSEIEFPNIASPLIMEVANIREKIESFWWENPARKLTFSDVKKEIPKRTGITVPDDALQKAFDYLVSEGFINKRLYNPRRTRQEYFWLLSTHLLINLVALTIEVINGGIQTPKGMYVSWDLRLSSFFLGLVFLFVYYKRYHVLKDLTRACGIECKYCKIFCCIKKDEPMQAIPDDEEMQRHLQLEIKNETTYKTIETQTSVISKQLEKGTDNFILDETHVDQKKDQRNENGIMSNALNQLRRFRNRTPTKSEDSEGKKNMECQTETLPGENNDKVINEEITEYKIDVPYHNSNSV